MLESMQAISAATIAMVPSVPPTQEQRPFRYRSTQGRKYGNYQGPRNTPGESPGPDHAQMSQPEQEKTIPIGYSLQAWQTPT